MSSGSLILARQLFWLKLKLNLLYAMVFLVVVTAFTALGGVTGTAVGVTSYGILLGLFHPCVVAATLGVAPTQVLRVFVVPLLLSAIVATCAFVAVQHAAKLSLPVEFVAVVAIGLASAVAYLGLLRILSHKDFQLLTRRLSDLVHRRVAKAPIT